MCDFQPVDIPQLLMMGCTFNRPQALLLVEGTGGWKSSVAQTDGCVGCGVVLIIEETLALAVDQKSKVGQPRNNYKPVLASQLDSIKRLNLIEK